MKTIILSLAVLITTTTAGVAHGFLTEVIDGPTPRGAKGLCEKYEWACSVKNTDYSEDAFDIITNVNKKVNRVIKPVDDEDQYGVSEKWVLPTTGKGDCEDYALQKKYELVQAGISPSRLYLLVVSDRGKGHVVLVYRGETTDYILDSLTNRVVEWDEMRYYPLLMQNPDNKKEWIIVKRGNQK